LSCLCVYYVCFQHRSSKSCIKRLYTVTVGWTGRGTFFSSLALFSFPSCFLPPSTPFYCWMKNIGVSSIMYFTIRVITKLPNSEQSYKGKVKTHNYINRQNQSTTGKLKTVMTLTWYRHF
jgi:hypothetical protein